MASNEEPYLPRISAPHAGNGEVSNAISTFGDALKQFTIGRSINQASQQLMDLKNSEASETDIRQKQSELAQQLGQRIIGLGGVPASQVQETMRAFSPLPSAKPQFTNVAELAAYGTPEQQENALNFFSKYKPPKEADPLTTELKSQRLQNAKTDEDLKVSRRFTAMSDALDEDKARTGEFGRQKQFVNNADRVLALRTQFPDGNLPPAQMAEFATSVASLIGSGSHAAEATVGRYVPHTSSGTVADIVQYLSNDPQGAGQQGFVKLMTDTAERERGLAQSKLKAVKYQRVASFGDMENRDKDRFNEILESQGVDPEEYQQFKKNGYKFPERITVISPDGKVGNIPKTQLKDALSAGYKQQ